MRTIFQKRKIRIRAKLRQVSKRPRLTVFRSNKHIYAQIIDDQKGKTLVVANDQQLKIDQEKLSPIEIARRVGKLLAQKAKRAKIIKLYFDRGGYKYHGIIKALAEGGREGGLEF